ncbi:class I SAM-dependent methyltransferase [Patescibacteria group bacterium]|nr:class I SAM-dependent methyltransferase [Patescibacteria group bacterium]
MSSQLNKNFVRICAETLPIQEPIYEFGSLQVEGKFADLRPYFPEKKYVGADMREGLGVDVILNLHNIDLPDKSVGTVIVLSTLEHVEFARKAVEEAHRILKPNGVLIISSVMNFPIHDYPSDYWRFTPEGFKSLLRPFETSFVEFVGEKSFPHTIVGVGIKGIISVGDEFVERIKQMKADARYDLVYLIKSIAPPFLVPTLRKIYNKSKFCGGWN